MFPNADNYLLILVIFEFNNENNSNTVSIKCIENRNTSTEENNYLKYCYRKGSARGGDITFTTKLSDPSKKFDGWLAQLTKHTELCKTNFPMDYSDFYLILNCVKSQSSEIKEKIIVNYNELPKEEKNTCGFSIGFEKEGIRYYLDQYESIRSQLINDGTLGKSRKYNVISENNTGGQCSICLQQKTLLYGFGSPYLYSSVDKPGMVSGFFKQANNWKNYPICPECSLEFEFGRRKVTSQLSNYFYGHSYYFIPKIIGEDQSENLKKITNKLVTFKENLKTESGKQRIEATEERFEKAISKEENYFNLSLLFYEENPTTKAIKIKLFLDEILPSRFNQLYVKIPAIVNDKELYHETIFVNKEEKKNLTFNFGLIKMFYEKDFLSVVSKIYNGDKLDKDNMYKSFMQTIRTNYKKLQDKNGKAEPTGITVLKAHLVYHYFEQLNIISTNKNYIFIMENEAVNNKRGFNQEKFEEFVKQNNLFFDTDYKVGLFALGILVKFLMNIQYQNLKSEPFQKKLKGYNLNAQQIERIYLDCLDKLVQYDGSAYYQDLKSVISKNYNLKTPTINNISSHEISFYFVTGIEMAKQFKIQTELEDKDQI